MPKKPSVQEAPEAAPRDEPDSQADAFMDALASVSDEEEARIDVYRNHPQTKKAEYMGRLDLTQYSLDFIRQEWGGGSFQLRLVVGTRYMKQKTVSIAGPFKDFSRVADVETPDERTERRYAETDAARERLAEISTLQAVAELRSEFRDLLRELRNPPPQAQAAPVGNMTRDLLETMQAMMTPYMELFKERMDALRGKDEPDPMAMVEAMRAGIELGQGSAGDSYRSVITEFGVPLLKMLQSGGLPGPMMNPQQQAVDAEAPPMREPSNALEALAPWMPTLIDWAVSGKDPRLRADLIVDELPPRYVDMLETFIAQPNSLTLFLTRFPQAGDHRVWFEQLFRGLSYAFGLSDEEEEDGNGPSVELGTGSPPED